MNIEKTRSEITYTLKLTSAEYSDITTALYWMRKEEKYGATYRSRVDDLYGAMSENV